MQPPAEPPNEDLDESSAISFSGSDLVSLFDPLPSKEYETSDPQLAALLKPTLNGTSSYKTPDFKWWYESIIDWMLMNPSGSMSDCAKALDRHPVTLRLVVKSDAFRARFSQRRADYNSKLSDQLTDQATRLALASLTELTDRVTNNAAKIPTRDLAELSSNVLERLGYGVKQSAAAATANVQVNIGVSADTLREAQHAMRTVQTINAQASEPPRSLSDGN